jgi:acyl dehydratase
VAILYFEDFPIGSTQRSAGYTVTRDEIIEFASRWDPQPWHLDEASARASVFGGLTASACHTFAISGALSSSLPDQLQLVAALGMDELRFPNPVRPGDRLCFISECIDRRESRSRPNIGIVTNLFTMVNQEGLAVMTMKATSMMHKRPQRPQQPQPSGTA